MDAHEIALVSWNMLANFHKSSFFRSDNLCFTNVNTSYFGLQGFVAMVCNTVKFPDSDGRQNEVMNVLTNIASDLPKAVKRVLMAL
jgi:hypothetical protein